MEQKLKIVHVKAPVLKRLAAFLIDAAVAFIPALAMYFVFTGGYSGWTPIWYESPVIAAVSMYDLPIEVHEKLNTFENPDGSSYQEYNVSFTATVCRVMSVVAIIFYVFYSTFCAYIFDGKTVGKKVMGLRMITRRRKGKQAGREKTEKIEEKTEEKGETAQKSQEEIKALEKEDNKKIFIREVLGKVLLNSIPIFPIISIFTILFTKEHLAVHDIMGSTMVVEELITEE